MTDAGWMQAKAAGLRTVIDLRNAPAETQRHPGDPIVCPESLEGVAFIAAPTEDPQDPEFHEVCGPWLDHPRLWIDYARLAPARIAGIMRAIATADTAVLVHCAGGRDRTGMVCAMLLDLAGAVVEAILDDYADGWRGAGSYSGQVWVYDSAQQNWCERYRTPTPPQELESQLTERAPTLREWAETFDTGAYLASIGLTTQEIDTLRKMFRP